MSLHRSILAFVASLFIGSMGHAAVVTFNSWSGGSTEGLGAFTGSMDYSFTNANNAQLIVSLTNTSPPANGGFITAFGFQQPGGITGVSLSTLTNLDTLLGGPTFSGGISAPPFAGLDIGAGLDNSWLGGGNPNPGIGVGVTGTWTFTLTGTGLDNLDSQSFVDELMVVRFRGFVDGGSDKVPTPEASSVILAGLGLAGVALLVRRGRKAKTTS